MQLAHMNRHLMPTLESVFPDAPQEVVVYLFIAGEGSGPPPGRCFPLPAGQRTPKALLKKSCHLAPQNDAGTRPGYSSVIA